MALTLAVSGIREGNSPPPARSTKDQHAPPGAESFETSEFANLKVQPPPMQGRRPPDFSFLGALDKHLYKTRNQSNKRSRGVFHPSEIDGCKRYLALDYLVVPAGRTAIDARVHRIFENGDGVHYRIQKYLRELADSYGVRAFFKKELKLTHPDLEIDGSTDGVFSFDDYLYLIEIKSINRNGFEKLRKPDAKHVKQVNRYMGVLGIQTTIFIYENKDVQDWKEFRVEFDPNSWQETVRIIEYVKATTRAGRLPPKEESSSCSGCKFYDSCIKANLPDDALVAMGRRLD